MPYVIDGHNLIPKLGMRLDDVDDELELVERLNEFCRLSRRRQVEVYFDNAPAGYPETQTKGLVTVHFVRRPLLADQAIIHRLKRLGRGAKNWSVVTSDHQVQTDARAMGAKGISSEEFAQTMIETLRVGLHSSPGERKMSERELEEWQKLFDNKDHKFGQF